jgi:hypothetical protein
VAQFVVLEEKIFKTSGNQKPEPNDDYLLRNSQILFEPTSKSLGLVVSENKMLKVSVNHN